mmetsp:Transcript_1873/g.2852  ORF Transcript_1873/g.2852 Transcript_1873/m.2852 type:complete len:132 (+) Transcript_1873:66-461(+)
MSFKAFALMSGLMWAMWGLPLLCFPEFTFHAMFGIEMPPHASFLMRVAGMMSIAFGSLFMLPIEETAQKGLLLIQALVGILDSALVFYYFQFSSGLLLPATPSIMSAHIGNAIFVIQYLIFSPSSSKKKSF